MCYVYIIRSIRYGKYYIGSTRDIKKRLIHHNQDSNQSTKKYRPYKLLYFEKYDTNKQALIRERKIKSYKGGKAFKLLIDKVLSAGVAE